MNTDHYYMGIDPSINHTGWGIIRATYDSDFDEVEWVDSGIIKPSSEGYGRLLEIGFDLWCLTDTVSSLRVAAVEQPTFENSSRGRVCAATKGLNKLYFAAGVCVGAVAAAEVPLAFITAWQWKGSCDKITVKGRVEEILHNIPAELRWKWEGTDEWEALGLAIWAWRHEGEYEVFK